MSDLIATWMPLVVIIVLLCGVIWFFSKRQMRDYGSHVDRVESINNELIDLAREQTAVAQRNSKLLEEIRDALRQSRDRK